MSRTRASIQEDIDQAAAAIEAYARDRDEAEAGRREAEHDLSRLTKELATTHYGETLVTHAKQQPENRHVELLDTTGAHRIATFLRLAADENRGQLKDIEVYISIDPAIATLDPASLVGHLWPVAAAYDTDGDVILYVTSGDRAQS